MTLIIAEAGVNHNGSDELAYALVDAAYRAGADIVKFQTFKAKNLVTEEAEQAEYQVTNSGQKESQFTMLKRLELSYDTHHKLVKYCQDKGIEFLSTAFDSESLNFLVNDLGITRLKLPSGEITNAPLVLEHARTGCDLIVSTGMATLSEIEQVLSVIAFGYLNKLDTPTDEQLQVAYFSDEGKRLLKQKVTLLHCTTEYPAPFNDINLNAMDTMADSFKLAVGYSDHSEGITVPIAAVAKGAVLIEKHFTVDKNLPGPDHKASLDPIELQAMVEGIRTVEQVLGDGIKGPRPSEVKNKAVARKSLVAAKNIEVGEAFSESNLAVKRPGRGINPIHFWRYLGSKSQQSYKAGDLINE
tara:strand:+ start:48 stop:1118 length:1071 start_codon:yes stop_codon:yes gene_type:complete